MFFLRIFSQSDISLDPIRIAQKADCQLANKIFDGWREIAFTSPITHHPVILERGFVSENREIQQEINEFKAELELRPGANSNWVVEYIKSTKILYTFEAQTLDDLRCAEILQTEAWLEINGLLQSDITGFRDELGYMIISPEKSKIKGRQRVAVLVENNWVRFSIDADNESQYRSFVNGKVPPDVAIHSVG